MNLTFSDANKILDKAELPIGVAGFVAGVSEADIREAMDTGVWSSLSTEQKAKFLANTTVGRLTGFKPFQDELGTRDFSFNATGFLNKGLAIWIVSWLYGEIGLPHHTTVKKIGIPLGQGWTLGGLFDPPPQQARQLTSRNQGRAAARQVRVASWWN